MKIAELLVLVREFCQCHLMDMCFLYIKKNRQINLNVILKT